MTVVRSRVERAPVAAFESWVDMPFPGVASRVVLARGRVGRVLAGRACRDDAMLVASELSANAVTHTRSGADLGMYRVVVYDGRELARVEVHDDGGVDTVPDLCPTGGEGGHGLHLVEALSLRWGCHGDIDGRCVWAELSNHPSLTGGNRFETFVEGQQGGTDD